MKIENLTSQLIHFSVMYRAVCLHKSYRGKWTDSPSSANSDADRHEAKTGHSTDIEVKQTQRMRISRSNKLS